MTAKNNFKKRVLSAILSVAIILSALPFALTASAAGEDGFDRKADPSTLDGWQTYFYRGENDFDTSNAGGIWTDKSVLIDNKALTDIGITGINNPSSKGFLSVLSAIGSNMTVTGQADVATDTVLVLDTSGSMGQSDIDAMVEATNITIKTLMDANPLNRVAVVFYSDSVSTFLPLDHYTTGTDGVFLTAEDNYFLFLYTGTDIVLDGDVRNSASQFPNSSDRTVTGGTYTALGIYEAMNILTADGNVVDQDANPCIPVVVLMTDGVPTYAHTNFTAPSTSGVIGDGNTASQDVVFATELTASYAKEKIAAKYGKDFECLFYTLGMGVSGSTDGYNEAVLDPVNKNSTALNTLWTEWAATQAGDTLEILDGTSVIKIESPTLSVNYVDKYISAATEADLVDAFKQILDDISLQTTYYPTLVDGSGAEFSGYISFVDKIGRYMKVKGFGGLIINDKLYDGSHMAQAFFAGELGSVEAPTELGDNLIWSIKQRLNIDADTARALVGSAYAAGQLYYKDNGNGDIDFSNYFGWYSDADNKFLGFWSEGSTVPANAKYINKSYLYLGENNETTGVRESEMMYATIRIRETIETGEQEVDFAIPATLIPTVTYNVKLDEMGEPIEITTNAESVSPIRLVYRTELDSRINKWTAGEVVDNKYITHESPEGNNFTYNSTDNEIYFYNNKWDFDGVEGYGTYNPYSYYRPSYQNNRHYYTSDAYLWVPSTTVTNGWDMYRGAKPAENDGNTYYYGAPVYYKTGADTYRRDLAFERVYDEALKAAVQYQGEDMWHIPAGYIRQAYANHPIEKSSNETKTLSFYASPYSEYSEGLANNNEEGHENIVGTTLGNNGKIILTPERGVKIAKELETGVAATDTEFKFEVTVSNPSAEPYEAYKLKADGTVDTSVTSVTFDSAGKAIIPLKAGEIIYIGDMVEGDTVTVTELSNTEYVLKALTVDGVADNDNTASVTLGKVDMPEMVFTNGTREKASLNVSKHITHPYGTNYSIPDKTFNINLTMTLEDGSKLANYTFADGSSTNSDGVITVPLAHNESKLISGIPDGVKVQVTEDSYAGFTATFNETSGTANDGIVTVTAASSTAVSVVNDYKANPPSISGSDITVKAVKNFGREWREGDTFTFVLEEEKADWQAMETGATQTITIDASHEAKGTTNPIEVTFTNAFLNMEYTVPGTYYYRVIEKSGTILGVNYDTSYHRFEVVVEDDQMDGTLNIKEVKASEGSAATVTGTYNVLATFNNGYSAEDAVANIQIYKHIVNNSNSPLATKQGFTFKVAEVNSFTDSVDWNEITAITDATSETGIVKYPITFTRQDMNNQTTVYKYYKIKEVDAGATGWTYDTSVKNIVIEVSDVGGALVAKAYEYTEGTVNDVPSTATSEVKVDFTNTYTVGDTTVVINDTDPAAQDILVNKILSGRAMEKGEFTFVIYDEDNGAAFTTGTTKKDGADKESVPVVFDKNLVFNTVGEYHFSVYEDTSSAKNGVTFDKSKYTFTVTVTDGGQGSLVATVAVDNGVNNNNEITFKNTYKAANIDYAITTAKKNYNRELIANEFSFYVAECDENGKVTGEKTLIYNDKQGNIEFPTKTYTEAGENYYLIWENIPEGDKMGIAYDDTQYLAKVSIIDNTEAGTLLAVLTVSKKAKGETAFSVVANNLIDFTNTYSAADAVVSFKGYKTVDGTALTDGAYSFELYLSNAQWGEVRLLDTKANGVADDNNIGSFTFTDVAIKENTNFIVKEKIPTGNDAKNGVTYDTAVYRIAVTVTDNGRGQLVPEVIVRTANGVPVDNISFTNKYKAEATNPLVFAGTKVLKGRDLENGEFKFYMQQTNEKFEALADTTPQSVVNDANGKFSFSALTYEKAGKYYYVISEDTTLGTEYVTFDDTKYYVTVTVTDNTDTAKLTAEYEIKTAADATATVNEVVFTNEYAKPPKTGDNSNVALWAAMLALSGMAVLGLTFIRKKEEDR